jgi:hypothetical protein
MDGAPVGFGLEPHDGTRKMISPVQSPQRSRHTVQETVDDAEDDDGMEYYDKGGYEDQEEEEYDDDDDDDGEYASSEYVGDEEHVPKMPEHFYSDVDSFLSRPPPKVKGQGKKSRAKERLDEQITKSASLPVIMPPRQKAPKMQVESKVNTGRTKGPGKKHGGYTQRPLDMSLVQQAFQYTEQLQQAALDDELMNGAEDDEGRATGGHRMKKSGSAPSASASGRDRERGDPRQHAKTTATGIATNSSDKGPSRVMMSQEEGIYGGTGSGSNRPLNQSAAAAAAAPKKSKGNMAKKLRTRTQSSDTGGKAAAMAAAYSSSTGGFDTSVQQEVTMGRNAVDFDALVANFEQGLTLQKLRAELNESKENMEKSKQAMRQISKQASSTMRL